MITGHEDDKAAIKVVGVSRGPQDEKQPIDEEVIAHST